MKEKEIADYLESHNFPEELRLYIERLCNGRDYSPWKALTESSEAVVKVSMAKNNRLTIKPYESKEAMLNEELEIARETIKEQAEEIKSLKKEAKKKAAEEVAVTSLPEDTPKPKRRSKKTENP